MQKVEPQYCEIRIRELTLITKPEFKGTAEDLRLGITGHWQDRDMLHGHNPDGSSIYRMPPVRYLPAKKPKVVALGTGIEELQTMYDSLGEKIHIRGQVFVIIASEMRDRTVFLGISNELYEYHSISPWLALNQKRYQQYIRMGLPEKRRKLLEQVFTGNLLSLSKGIGYTVPDQIMVRLNSWHERNIDVKKTPMLGFHVVLTTNFILPSIIGIGRHASLGFGRFSTRGGRQ